MTRPRIADYITSGNITETVPGHGEALRHDLATTTLLLLHGMEEMRHAR